MAAGDSLPKENEIVMLPQVSFAPNGYLSRPADSEWIRRPQIHSDDDGGYYLMIPAQHMEVTFSVGQDEQAAEFMEWLARQLQREAEQIRENLL